MKKKYRIKKGIIKNLIISIVSIVIYILLIKYSKLAKSPLEVVVVALGWIYLLGGQVVLFYTINNN